MNTPNNSESKPNQQPATLNGMLHLTINTGHCVIQDSSFLWPDTYEALKPLLRHRVGIIPGNPDFTVAWHTKHDTHAIVIAKYGEPVILCALAAGKHGANDLWNSLLSFKIPLLCTAYGISEQPATTPWLAVALLPNAVTLNPYELSFLGCFEACLGLAIMRNNAELN